MATIEVNKGNNIRGTNIIKFMRAIKSLLQKSKLVFFSLCLYFEPFIWQAFLTKLQLQHSGFGMFSRAAPNFTGKFSPDLKLLFLEVGNEISRILNGLNFKHKSFVRQLLQHVFVSHQQSYILPTRNCSELPKSVFPLSSFLHNTCFCINYSNNLIHSKVFCQSNVFTSWIEIKHVLAYFIWTLVI